MVIIENPISKIVLKERYLNYFKTIIKAVVDLQRETIALDAELHSDLEEYLLENGSKQENLWGINLHPFETKKNFIEFTALINIRPYQNNRSMEIKDMNIRKVIKGIVYKLIYDKT